MKNLYILFGSIALIVLILGIVRGKFGDMKTKAKYQYKHKDFFLTRAEHECYDALVEAVGQEYRIFAQVHLPTLVDSKVVGQNWHGAFRHISEKSVDFVLCDKAYLAPKLAIELDDKSHERPERRERDEEVERILREAGVPLLRLENHGSFSPREFSEKIKLALNNSGEQGGVS